MRSPATAVTAILATLAGCSDEQAVSKAESAPAVSLTEASGERCSDILADGTKMSESFKQSDKFHQIMQSRLATTSYSEAKDKSATGLTALIGPVFFTGDYGRDEYNARQQQVRRSLDVETIRNNETQVALFSGDATIVGAWKDCMTKERAGLGLWFSPVNGSSNLVTLNVEWFPAVGKVETRVQETFELPEGVVATYNAGCIRRGKRLVATDPCKMQIKLPNSLTDLPIVLQADGGAAEAYLPKRLVLNTYRRNASLNRLRTSAGPDRQRRSPTVTNVIDNAKIAEGWRYDTGSLTARLRVHRAIAGGSCSNFRVHRKNQYQFGYSYSIVNGRNATTTCSVDARGSMIRQAWEGAKA